MLHATSTAVCGFCTRFLAGLLVVLTCAIGAAGMGSLAGCVDLEGVRQERERGSEVVSTLKSRATEYQTSLDALAAGDPARAELAAGLERAARARDALSRRVQELGALEERARKEARIGEVGGDGVEGVEGGLVVGGVDVMDLVPGPWKVVAVLSVGLATSLVRSKQLRDAAASMARSIDKALEEDEKLAERFRQHANTLRTIQTPLARKIVDEGQ